MSWVKNLDKVVVFRSVPLALERGGVISLIPKKKAKLPTAPSLKAPWTVARSLPKSSLCSVSCGFSAPIQIRFVHTDVTKIPDFSDYRLDSTKNPNARTIDSEVQRKAFMYTMLFAAGVMTTTAAKYAVKTFVMPLGPTAKTLAEASIDVNLSAIPEGKNVTLKWRNKPLFIRHRTAEEIARERSVGLESLRHKESDESRVKKDAWLICLGVCTHLGCIPIAHAGDFPGGYYCPCHGSHYDASGRIRKGPAPLNLEVPEYTFIDENTVRVG